MSFTFDQAILQFMIGYFLAGSAIGPVVSQSLLDFMIFLIFVCFAVLTVKIKFKNISEVRKLYLFEYGFLFYFLAVILGMVILGVNDFESWIKLSRFSWIINFYLFAWALTHIEIDLSKMINFFTWAFVIPNVYALISVFFKYDFIHQQPLAYPRLTGLLGSSTYHAHANGIICIFFLTLLVFKFKSLSKSRKLFSLIAASLMLMGIFFTFTRGVWIGLSIAALCLLWFEHRKIFIAVIIAGAVLSTGLYNFSETFHERIGVSSVTTPIDRRSNTPPTDTISSDKFRLNLLKLHFAIFDSSPLVGIGFMDNLSHTPPETWEKHGFSSHQTINTHAHNQYVNTLTMTGLLGFVPFLLFYFWFFFTNLRLIKYFKEAKLYNHYALATGCLLAQLEFMIANMTDIGFEYAKIRSLILLVWALVFVLWKNKAKIVEAETC